MNCQSCGMPMDKPEDHGGGDVNNSFCQYCTDEQGNLLPKEQVRAKMVQFYVQKQSKTQEEAEKLTDQLMSSMPAWKGEGTGQPVAQPAEATKPSASQQPATGEPASTPSASQPPEPSTSPSGSQPETTTPSPGQTKPEATKPESTEGPTISEIKPAGGSDTSPSAEPTPSGQPGAAKPDEQKPTQEG